MKFLLKMLAIHLISPFWTAAVAAVCADYWLDELVGWSPIDAGVHTAGGVVFWLAFAVVQTGYAVSWWTFGYVGD